MKIAAYAVKALVREGQHRFGSFKALTVMQRPVKAMGINAELDTHEVVV